MYEVSIFANFFAEINNSS